jgi:hypothetical protein
VAKIADIIRDIAGRFQKRPSPGYFTGILRAGIEQGKVPGKTEEAKTWYRETASKFSSVKESDIFSDSRLTNRVSVGSAYFFMYDPKHKVKLPYYDSFPMVFPFSKTKNGFLGINVHYLHPVLRARLMDMLYEFANKDELDDKTKLRINWEILKNASAHPYVAPCVKRYLSAHYRSRFVYISPQTWDVALFLPVERFQKLSKTAVWAASVKIKEKVGTKQ